MNRPGASEQKFLVERPLGLRIADWARGRLPADPHGAGPFGDEYRITSVYFDTDRYDVLNARRSFGRSKYRVRRYGASDVVFLERKLRRPGLLHKRRSQTVLSELPRLSEPAPDEGWAGEWFHRRLLVRQLRPVCELTYVRVARAADADEALMRLTIDDHLRVRPSAEIDFGPAPNLPVAEHCMVLELKFRHALPALFKQLLETFPLTALAGSKYRLGMMALGHQVTKSAPAARPEASNGRRLLAHGGADLQVRPSPGLSAGGSIDPNNEAQP